MSKTNRIIDVFTQHKVAANLVMIMMVLSVLWAATRINTQLDPSVDWPGLFIIASWPGALSLLAFFALTPLMLENVSLALCMVPVAITLCFGLAFATLLALLLIPALILMIENSRENLRV
jgi:multidrug efflux pump subunit AcrB